MRNLILSIVITALASTFLCEAAVAIEGRLMRYPDIHGERVVFTYEDDLWSAPVGGGLASRLTSHPGIESRASFSPDGERIAFTGSYDGGYDVYTIPSTGGEPRRLTYHPAYDRVVGWTPDGKSVLFVSARGRRYELYKVDASGGYPEKL
ncbi:MAG: PD40 domain-containing protein, partial [Candidatus Krumholzibacteria bacterium]|nr:PD40 domain-containing protein [Candidatus Krumholzibacteria bacterium]